MLTSSVSDEYFVRSHFELMYIEWNIQRVSQKNIWELWEKCCSSEYITYDSSYTASYTKNNPELKIFDKPGVDRWTL